MGRKTISFGQENPTPHSPPQACSYLGFPRTTTVQLSDDHHHGVEQAVSTTQDFYCQNTS